MKKKVLIIIAALAALSLSACSNKPPSTAPQVESGISSTTSATATESASESSTESTSSFELVVKPSGESESKAEKKPTADSTLADTSTRSAQNQAQQPTTVREPEQPPQTKLSSEPTVSPSISQEPLPPTQEPEPTPEPTKPEPMQPTFDVSRYVSYVKSYGVGIGLALDISATGCWDTPIEAHAGCIYLERDIRDCLDWYAASGYTAFWVWSVDVGGGNYEIYIGYA